MTYTAGQTVLYDILAPGGTRTAINPILTENTWEIKRIREEPGGPASEVPFHLNLPK